jgi:hypothetical protein
VSDDSSAERTFVAGWSAKPGCRNFADEFRAATGSGPNAGGVYSTDDTGFDQAVADLGPLVDARLRELQTASLQALLVDGSQLSRGDGTRATDVEAAAERVQGAEALIQGYVTLGLPQALASDDTLRGLLAGEAADALLHPQFDANRAAFAATVPGQVVSFLQWELANGVSQTDPLETLRILFRRHTQALEDAIGTYIKTGRAANQDPAADGGRLDEGSPLVTSTLDRLELTRAVLADHLAHTPAAPSPTPPAPAPQPVAPVKPPAAGPTVPLPTHPAAPRARVVRAPVARRGAIRFTVRCLRGTCRLATTVAAGRRPVVRRRTVTIAVGRQRTVTVRLSAAGRRLLARRKRLAVTVTIALRGTAHPLVHRRLTLR